MIILYDKICDDFMMTSYEEFMTNSFDECMMNSFDEFI